MKGQVGIKVILAAVVIVLFGFYALLVHWHHYSQLAVVDTALNELAKKEQAYFLKQGEYTSDLKTLGFALPDNRCLTFVVLEATSQRCVLQANNACGTKWQQTIIPSGRKETVGQQQAQGE